MKNPYIVLIDYGVGNTYSVFNSISFLGYTRVKVSDKKNDISNADIIILPGVGAFEACMQNLVKRNLDDILGEFVLVKKKTILGICVGMQLMATQSTENGIHAGLNWIQANVEKLSLPGQFKVPHVGWNNIVIKEKNPLFRLLDNNSEVNYYFDHSYHFKCSQEYVSAFCEYGDKIVAAINKDNMFGVQFHPEKSQTNGLKLFRSLLNS